MILLMDHVRTKRALPDDMRCRMVRAAPLSGRRRCFLLLRCGAAALLVVCAAVGTSCQRRVLFPSSAL